MLKKKLNQCQFLYKLYVDDDHQLIFITDSIKCRKNDFTSLSRPFLNGFLFFLISSVKVEEKEERNLFIH